VRHGLLTLIVCAASGFLARTAHAYPQWQFTTGADRCDECHFAPAGGGLINSFGRDVAGDELSSFGGNGALLHGYAKTPGWVALGGDVRGAMASQDVQDPNGTSFGVFPMQADADIRLAYGSFSLYGVAGLRGQERVDSDIVPIQNYQPVDTSRFVSREHWLMVRSSALGGYLRLGRFFAPFGLRMAEHILYVRRDLGFDTLEESYNLSSGFVAENWEVHATAFAPDFVRHMGSQEGGFTAYAERRFASVAAVAAQTRIAVGPGMTRTIVGGLGKYWLPPLRMLFLAEGDFVRRDLMNDVPTSYQFVGVGGVSVLPVRGIIATFLYERNQVDLSASNAAYNAATAFASWFPYAHFELQALGRLQFPSGGDAAKTFFIQLHYYL
jgi:hypothetical protein